MTCTAEKPCPICSGGGEACDEAEARVVRIARIAGHRFPRRGTKRVGDEVKLRALWWDGQMPREGDLLRTSTGRTYLVLFVLVPVNAHRGAATPFSIRAMVMPDAHETPAGCTEFRWSWTRKTLRRPKAFSA